MKPKICSLTFIIVAIFSQFLFTGCGTKPELSETYIPQTEVIEITEDTEIIEAIYEETLCTLGQSVDEILSNYNFRGVALVIKDGETILRAAYSMACDIQGIENTVYLPFHLASISKHFTGAAILLLEQEGKLDTSYTLDKFFDGNEGLSRVTIAHLLAMRGGFLDYSNWMLSMLEDGEFEKVLSLSIEDIEAHIISTWRGTPQHIPFYCNSDYWLLGRIIHQVTGMPYEEFISSRLFTPVGMYNSGFNGIHESVMPHNIPAIYFDGQNMMAASNWPFHFTYSTGGLISTIDDLNIWLEPILAASFSLNICLMTLCLTDTIMAGLL